MYFSKLSTKNLKEILEEKTGQYNHPSFIDSDPIQIPHLFSKKKDIEVAGFLTAILSWGNRKTIIKKSKELMNLMSNRPHEFILHHISKDLEAFSGFKHRTFQYRDVLYFFKSLQNIYTKYDSLEGLFSLLPLEDNPKEAIMRFRRIFFAVPCEPQIQRHLSNPQKGSAAKRLHMFLRWMVRKDLSGVDLGIWKKISPSKLSCPLDLHSASTARKLGLLVRKQNDIKSVFELDQKLRYFDKKDPVKYDFALFGLGAFEGF